MALLFALATAFAQKPTGANEEFFEMRIRPLFVNMCYACHTEEHMGGLQLDTAEHALKGGKSGVVIVPGDPAGSLMVKALHYNDARLKMPPTGRLSDSQIADVETWIKNGALWPQREKAAAAPSPRLTSSVLNNVPSGRSGRSRIQRRPPFTTKNGRAATLIVLFSPSWKSAIKACGRRQQALAHPPRLLRSDWPPAYARRSFELLKTTIRRTLSPKSSIVFSTLHAMAKSGAAFGWTLRAIPTTVSIPSATTLTRKLFSLSRLGDPSRAAGHALQSFRESAGRRRPVAPHERYEAGLGFYSLSPEFQDERVDATTRGFMALTVACATCHNHKYDPIPAQDYYSLLGIFNNTELHETPLAPKEEVERYEAKKKRLDAQEREIKDFISRQSSELAEILAQDTASYMLGSGAT